MAEMEGLREAVETLKHEVRLLRETRESIAYVVGDYPHLKRCVESHETRIDSLEGTRDRQAGGYLAVVSAGSLAGAIAAILTVLGLKG